MPKALLILIFSLVLAGPLLAEPWAEGMFGSLSHDFGNIARGSKAVYRFQVKNIYKEPVHIAGVRSSCGCTSPRVVNPDLKTFDTGEIVAQFNTLAFRGRHSATLTVLIDKPYPAEIRLQVSGNVRSDVVFHPGSIQFGSVVEGSSTERKVSVNYAGRNDWKILDVRCANTNFEVEIDETRRSGGRVAYDLLVRLKEAAKAGYLQDQLVLVSNDQRSGRIPLDVSGRIVPAITVTPNPLMLGDVSADKTVKKKLVVRGKEPFRILNVDCQDDCFSFEFDGQMKSLHLVQMKFHPHSNMGVVQQEIHFLTNCGEKKVTLVAHATVLKNGDQ